MARTSDVITCDTDSQLAVLRELMEE